MDKMENTNSRIDIFEYIKLCNDFVLKQKDIRNKYNYLLATLKNDYDNKLNQMNFLL